MKNYVTDAIINTLKTLNNVNEAYIESKRYELKGKDKRAALAWCINLDEKLHPALLYELNKSGFRCTLEELRTAINVIARI